MRVYSKRPQPGCVEAIIQRLALTTEWVRLTTIVSELRKATGCSRATAYRAVSDALREGSIMRVMPDTARSDDPPIERDMNRLAGDLSR